MIENLTDLKRLLKLLRQNGVTEITLGTCSLKMGELPKAMAGDTEELGEQDEFADLLEAPITNEELVAFSNGAQ